MAAAPGVRRSELGEALRACRNAFIGVGVMQKQALDRFGTAYGICNPLYGVQMVFSEDMR